MHYTRETKVGIFILAAFAVLIFMGFYLGAYRFDRNKYTAYTFYFKDVSGLAKKAEIKIAGVPVGWVEELSLARPGDLKVRADLKIDKMYTLYQDAYGLIRQDGLIGPTYVEIVPGTPGLAQFSQNSACAQHQPEQMSADMLMRSMHDVTLEMKEVVRAVKTMISAESNTQQIIDVVSGVHCVVDGVQSRLMPNALNAFDQVTAITRDINQGKGVFGRMMHDDTVYDNIARTTGFLRNVCDRFSHLFFTYDGHIEDMFQRASFSCFKNAKGIFNVRIYPRADFFYLIGVTSSQQGYVTRTLTFPDYVDNCLNQICPTDELPEWAKYQYLYNREIQQLKRNAFRVDLQFGKLYKNIALRAGLIEGTAGFAVDIFVPYRDRHGLISTLKMYDFRGQNRLFDERPHLKWINRIFLFDTVYIAFGLDDFVSKCNKAVFLGAGFRFGDADIKYFLPNYAGLG